MSVVSLVVGVVVLHHRVGVALSNVVANIGVDQQKRRLCCFAGQLFVCCCYNTGA